MVVKKAVKMANMMNLSVIGLVKTTAIRLSQMWRKIEVFGKSRGEEGLRKRKSLFRFTAHDHNWPISVMKAG